MTIPSLGTLVEADLREAWNHEAHSFTPWLTENLAALAEVIGIPLELEGREVSVDEFSADILARNPMTGDLVLIENQLAGSDHSHLGQIMTYLAGLDARVVIWIASGFREAHLSAVRWLNEHTDENFAFFAVKVRVVRISDSPLAPVFDVLERPNQWERSLQTVAQKSRSLSELGQFRLEFWEQYVRYNPDEAREGPPTADSTRTRHVDGVDVILKQFLGKDGVGVYIRGPMRADSEAIYTLLEPYAEQLTAATGAPIGDPKKAYLFVTKLNADTTDRTRWPEFFAWLKHTVDHYEVLVTEILR